MVDNVSGINADHYFKDKNTELDIKYDFNGDKTVDIADYEYARITLINDDPADDVKFTLDELNRVFAALIADDANNIGEIDEHNANDHAERIIADVGGDLKPSKARTLNELQTIGATLTRYIKESAEISKILAAQADKLMNGYSDSDPNSLKALQAEKENKEHEYQAVEDDVKTASEELNELLAKSLNESERIGAELERKCKSTVNKVIDDYMQGKYPGQSLQAVILDELGETAGASTGYLKRQFDEATTKGNAIKSKCRELENLAASIRDVNVRYNEKNEVYNRTVNNRTNLLAAAKTASNSYQNGYTVRQNMRTQIINTYKTTGNGSVESDNPQLAKLNAFLDDQMLSTMPYADAYHILKNTFDKCGIKFNDKDHSLSVPKGHDGAATNIHNALVQQIHDNYGVDAERNDDGYSDPSDPTNPGGTTRNDPISFTTGNTEYHFIADKNNNGKFDNMKEFLGAEDGWDEMVAYDENEDGIISGKELEKLQLVTIDKKTGQYTFKTAAEADVKAINLSSYKKSGEMQNNGDILEGNFKIYMNDGKTIDGVHTLDTERNIENNYSTVFGAEIKDHTDNYEENPFMENFVETTNTDRTVSQAESEIRSTQNKSDETLNNAENKVNSKVSTSVDEAKSEKAKQDRKAEEKAKAEKVAANKDDKNAKNEPTIEANDNNIFSNSTLAANNQDNLNKKLLK